VGRLLKALDEFRPLGWLQFDGFLRDYGDEGRRNIGQYLDELTPTLSEHPRRRFQIGQESPIQFWLFREASPPNAQEVLYQAQVGCLTVGAANMRVLLIACDKSGRISGLRCETHPAPSVLQIDYPTLREEADRQRARMIALG
jgi:hypothetical protein